MRICLRCQRTNPERAIHCQACGGILALQVGSELQGMLRRYKVEQILGSGGFGVTYLVKVLPTTQRVVLKELQAQHIHDTKVRELFEREAQALAMLDPARGVPDIMDFFYGDGQRVYMVMEYVAGEPLSALIAQREKLPLAESVKIGIQVLEVLAYIHSQGVVHRDVKPQNIMVREDGNVTLIDFGAVKEAAMMRLEAGEPTATGIQTPGYAPPEQARGLSVNQTADLYALAATLMALLTGLDPRELTNPQTGDFEWRDYVDVSDGLTYVIKKATAYRPIDRYQSAGAMLEDLKSVAEAEAWAQQLQLEMLYRTAQTHLKQSAWAEARETYQRIEALSPGYRDVSELLVKVEAVLNAASARVEADQMLRQAERELLKGFPEQEESTRTAEQSQDQDKAQATLELDPRGAGERPEAKTSAYLDDDDADAERKSSSVPQKRRPALRRRLPVWVWVIVSLLTVGGIGIRLLTLGQTNSRMRASDSMVMVYVPGGTFEMGSDNGALDEQPVRTVAVHNFWIDQTEVTNFQYKKCVEAQACAPPTRSMSNFRLFYYDEVEYNNYPVVYVSWEQANTYCKWAGARLPTEEEWEYAARGPESLTYPWGNSPPDETLLNYNAEVEDTTEVGAYPDGASWCGALDMAGNVKEWVADWYSEQKFFKVLRGGSWRSEGNGTQAAHRNNYLKLDSRDDIGFRCAVSAEK